jgi:hypothetical protein
MGVPHRRTQIVADATSGPGVSLALRSYKRGRFRHSPQARLRPCRALFCIRGPALLALPSSWLFKEWEGRDTPVCRGGAS